MKRFFWILLLAGAAVISASAQTAVITGPSNPISATGAITITGTAAGGATSVAVTVTYLATGGAVTVTPTSSSVSSGVWSASFTPAAVGDYFVRATPSTSSATGTANTATLVVASIAPTASLSFAGGGVSIPAGSVRYLNATTTAANGAVARVTFFLDGAAIGTVSSPTTTNGTTYALAFTAPTTTGSHTVVAVVYDNLNVSSPSSFLTIEVTSPIGSAPIAGLNSPISGAFLPVSSAATVSGTVSDSDGSVSKVEVFANGISVTSVTNPSGNWSLSWTPSSTGAVQLSAIATDDKGNTTLAPAVTVNVTDTTSPAITLGLSPNTAAVAASTTLPAGATRNIVATVTPAAGRAVVRVEFFVDGTKVGEKTAAPYSYRYTAPASGTNVVSVRATDNTSLSRDAQAAFTVTSVVGQPPTVNLLTPTNGTTVVPNTSVSLAASALATGGTISSVQFYVNGSPASVNSGNAVTIPPATSYASTFTPTQPGTYVIDAIATDDRGNNTVSNSVTIKAAFGTPTVSITSPNPNVTARATPNIPMTIAATAQGGSGAQVILVEFLLDGVQIGTRNLGISTGFNTIYSFSWTPTTAQLGLHEITARVTDTNSLSATSGVARVNVATVVGTPPAISISTSPVPAQGLQTLSTVNFIGNAFANGAGATISNVEFFLNDSSIGLAAREQTTNLYRLSYDFSRFDFSALTPDINTGRYAVTLYAIARDSNSNQTISTTSTLSFNPSTSAPPTVTLQSLGGNAVAQNTQFPMVATPVDNDGSIATVQLYANGAIVNNAIITNLGGQYLVSYPSPTAGRFNLFVVVTDDTGNTAVSSPAVVLNVTALGTPTTAVTRPSDDSTVTNTGAPVFLEATASSPDTTGALTVTFVPTASNGSRGTAITATRVGLTNTYRAVFTTATADTYTISSSATFSGVTGNSANSRKVVVNNIVGLAPTVSVSAPTSGSSVSSASITNFVANATDPDGSVVSVEFFLNRNSIGQATRDPQANTWRLTTSFAGITPGSSEVVAIVRDSSGNIAASTTGTINIVAATSAPPTVTLLANPTTVAFGQPIALTANAADVDGAIASVQYFVNGASVGASGTAATNFQVNWTSTTAGTFNVFAVATDNSAGTANTAVSATLPVTVKRNNPIVEVDAFIQQTFSDLANTTANAVQLASYDQLLASGGLTRAQFAAGLTEDNVNFTNVVNVLAAYYVYMGQWPTSANYTTIFNARGNLATVCGLIVASPEFLLKYQLPIGVTLTTAVLDNATGPLPARTFEDIIWASAGLGTPSDVQRVQFRNNPTASTTTTPPVGRGYSAAGLNTALSDFITVTNKNNTALFAAARAAAFYYQLDRPSVVTAAAAFTATTPVVTQDAAGKRIAALAALGTDSAAADAILKDVLYTYRFVTILTQPQPLTVAARSGALFRVEAIGQPPLSYQWLLNGAPVVGATSPLLSVTSVDTSKSGTYTVAVTSAVGSAISDPATLTLTPVLTKLGNISTRGVTSSGAQTLIAGFVVTGPANQTRQMLIRVIGPGLATQGVTTGLLADPRLEVYGQGSATVPIQSNDNWGTQTANPQTNAAAVTAIQQATQRVAPGFPLTNTASADAVVLATLSPGTYTVQAKGLNAAASGIVLVEVYDATVTSVATNPKAINVSTRGVVGSGASSLIAGFVINGAASRRVLIRGVGPTLSRFGLSDTLLVSDPQIELFNSSNVSLRKNDDWASGDDAAVIASASVAAGAFALTNGSKDSAMIIMLPPGGYSVQMSGVGSSTGIGLVEVYDVDP